MADNNKGLDIEPLDSNNYHAWAFQMKNVLIVKELWGAVTGTKTEEEILAKALARICLNVTKQHISTLSNCKTPKEAWTILETTYKSKSEAKKLQLQQELLNLKKSSKESVTEYINRARRVKDDLISAGEDSKGINLVGPVLNGLPSEYTSIRLAFVAQPKMPTMDELHSKLITAEQILEPTNRFEDDESDGVKAFLAKGKFQKGKGKVPSSGQATGQASEMICFFCDKRGHRIKDCEEFKEFKFNQRSWNGGEGKSRGGPSRVKTIAF